MVRRPEFSPSLMSCESIARAAYNPREADEFRDGMLKLSIGKFGWLIPAFVDPSNELLSGHQRQRLSMALGAKEIPVGHKPSSDKWQFDESVTVCFDDMLRRSIPQYDVMRKSVFEMGCRYVRPKTAIFDLGCSRGDALDPFVRKFGAHNRYVGIEVSGPMLQESQKRFATLIDAGVVSIRNSDLRKEFPQDVASLVLSVLTLQFVPINYRQEIVQKSYDALVSGGAMILVEKILGADAAVNSVLVDQYHKLKAENGYSQDDIERKSLSLEGVLVPVTAKWNEDILREAGFRSVDCFWRYMNFAAWVAVKR